MGHSAHNFGVPLFQHAATIPITPTSARAASQPPFPPPASLLSPMPLSRVGHPCAPTSSPPHRRLEGAVFKGANLRNADLESGNYEDADFSDAILEGAFVNNAQFVRVRRARV